MTQRQRWRRLEAIPGRSLWLHLVLLFDRGILSSQRGDLEAALEMYEQLRREYRSIGDVASAHRVAYNIALCEQQLGRTQRAVDILNEILPDFRAGQDPHVLYLTLTLLASYCITAGDLEGAVTALREVIGKCARLEPDSFRVADATELLALVNALRGDYVRAAKQEGYAEAAFRQHGFHNREEHHYDRLMALLREGLAPDELERLLAEGAGLLPEAVIALALED